MTQRPDETNPLDPFGMVKGMRDANMEVWSKAMQQFVNSEAYSQASGAMLDAYLTSSAPFRKLLEQTMTQVLTQLNMPTRTDVNAIAERLTNIEMRLDDLDARLSDRRPTTQPPAADHSPAVTDAAKPSDAAPVEAQAMDPVVDTISETGAAPSGSTSPRKSPRRSPPTRGAS